MPGSSLSFGCPRWSRGSHLACAGRAPWAGRGSRGVCSARSSGALLARQSQSSGQEEQMSQVVIGMDPHKRSATIEVMAADETVLGGGRYATDAAGYAAMLAACAGGRSGPGRSRAARASAGTSRSRLVADGEQVVDVPPKLSARTRVFATGQGRKTDATDAHSVALVGTRMPGCARSPTSAARGAAGAGRPAPVAGRGPHPDGLPAAPAAAGADPRRGEEGPVRGPGQGAAGPGAAAGCRPARPAAGSPPS